MKIIIPVIVGGIIGYFTNWLAIKMLFRPHYEKRVMGIKIPFTPGLIPKERQRIAKSIGDTVGVHLLSPDTIVKALSNERTDREIRGWLEKKIEELKENQSSIKELLVDRLGEDYHRFKDKINNIHVKHIYRAIGEKLENFIFELTNSEKLKDGLKNRIRLSLDDLSKDHRKLSELAPEEILLGINNLIDENKNEIGNSIKEIFNDTSIQNRLKTSISELVLQNTNKVIMAFISPELISEKILHMIQKYIHSEDSNGDIHILLKSSLDKLWESKISEVVPKLEGSFDEAGLSKIADMITNYLNKNIETILNSDKLEESISSLVEGMIDEFINKPISSMAKKIDEDIVLGIHSLFRQIFNEFAIHELPPIIQFFNISKIVEDKINSFDVNFTEELILEIASKELKAITWLGALLGGILGLLSPLLQMLY